MTCPNHLFINQANTEQIGTSEVDLLAKEINSTGDIAILSAAATATNQNAWIGFMKQQLTKYPNMHLVSTVYGNDDPATSLTVLQGLLSAYPNLAGIISPTTVGISTAAQYLATTRTLLTHLTLTGLGLPSQMKPYIKDGTVKAFELWNPTDLGYLAGYAAASLASGTATTNTGRHVQRRQTEQLHRAGAVGDHRPVRRARPAHGLRQPEHRPVQLLIHPLSPVGRHPRRRPAGEPDAMTDE